MSTRMFGFLPLSAANVGEPPNKAAENIPVTINAAERAWKVKSFIATPVPVRRLSVWVGPGFSRTTKLHSQTIHPCGASRYWVERRIGVEFLTIPQGNLGQCSCCGAGLAWDVNPFSFQESVRLPVLYKSIQDPRTDKLWHEERLWASI